MVVEKVIKECVVAVRAAQACAKVGQLQAAVDLLENLKRNCNEAIWQLERQIAARETNPK
ncbi:MAG TPA: hypothetical protein VGH29_20695 [Candidatus Binataceae bacterium]